MVFVLRIRFFVVIVVWQDDLLLNVFIDYVIYVNYFFEIMLKKCYEVFVFYVYVCVMFVFVVLNEIYFFVKFCIQMKGKR